MNARLADSRISPNSKHSTITKNHYSVSKKWHRCCTL